MDWRETAVAIASLFMSLAMLTYADDAVDYIAPYANDAAELIAPYISSNSELVKNLKP